MGMQPILPVIVTDKRSKVLPVNIDVDVTGSLGVNKALHVRARLRQRQCQL